MDEFIKIRKDTVNFVNSHSFPLAFLETFEKDQKLSKDENDFLATLKYLFELAQDSVLDRQKMFNLFAFLGKDDYINAYIRDLFIKNHTIFGEQEIGNEVIALLSREDVADPIIYTLLDSSIECDSPWADKELLLKILDRKTLTPDTFSIIIDYLYHFRIDGFKTLIYTWLQEEYPFTIKTQLIDLLIELYSIDEINGDYFSTEHFKGMESSLLDSYMQISKKNITYPSKGLTILQSMFYGDFENTGKGNNGGLAIFLKNLGTELSKSKEIDAIITVTITNKWSANQQFIQSYSKNHLFLRIPVYIDKSNTTQFLKKQRLIQRLIKRFLERLEITPDIFHMRYLDNASKAIAGLSKDLEKKLVLTLAPDPHRNMTDQEGSLNTFSPYAFVEKLNKIMIGDELIDASDKIVGIGNRIVKKELYSYFPQLLKEENQYKVQMISEGIQTDISLINRNQNKLSNKNLEKIKLPTSFLERPIILNVGRLNKLKAQDQLLKAWGNSQLSEVYNLLIIGGDLESPDVEEKEMMNIFEEYFKEKTNLKEHFLHLGALPNYIIRKIEQIIRAEQKEYPQVYLCSSQKEEFGIAILEALSQGLLVLAPEKGGVKSYLKNDENGFLIDTTNWESIAENTEAIIESLQGNEKAFEKIQQAGEATVNENFSLATITEDFLSLYLSLQEKK